MTDTLATLDPVGRKPCRHDGALSAKERDALAGGGFMTRLPAALVDAILARVRVWRVASGETILRIGQPVEHWLGVASGSALVFMSVPHQAELQCTNWAPAGVWFNLYNPVALPVCDVEVRAEGATTIVAMHADDLQLLCERFAELSVELAVANAGHFRRALQIAVASQRATLKQRQLLWLVEQARDPETPDACGHTVLNLSQDTLARSYGVSRQAWCEGMKELEAEGLVRRSGAYLGVADLPALEAAMDAENRAVESPYMAPQRPPAQERPARPDPAGPRAAQALRTAEQQRVCRGRWFRSLAPGLQQRLFELGEVRRVAAGATVLQANEWPLGCWLVVDGAIRLDNPHAAPPHRTIALLPPGAWYSHHDLVYNSPNQFDAVALHASTLMWLPAHAFEALFRESLDYRLALIRLLALEQSQAARYACSFNWPIETRVGIWLQMMHRYFDLTSGAGPRVAASFTLEDVAQWLGTTRQAVSRQLKAFEAEGVIRRSRTEVELLQPDRLPSLIA